MDSIHNTFTSNPFDHKKVRMVLDTMDDAFGTTYVANPDRAFIIDTEDRMALVSREISDFDPEILMTDEIRDWLEKNL